MKRVFKAYPILGGCGTKKKSVNSTERVDIAELTKKLKNKARYITVDGKYCDEVCEILDSKGLDYTIDEANRGKDCRFHIIYE